MDKQIPAPEASYSPKAVARFLKRVGGPDPVTGCRPFLGVVTPAGYGQMMIDGVTRYAHRMALEIATQKPIPDGMVVDHRCRNRACLEPTHLEAVSPSENTRRGLSSGGKWTRGTSNGRSKLTPDDVRAIRAAYSYQDSWALADRYGISRKQVINIAEGKSWSWLD